MYVATLAQLLTVSTAPSWIAGTNQFYLTTNADTPDYTQAAGTCIYSTSNEASGTNWAAGGLTMSQLGNIAPAVAGSGKILNWSAGNVSVANTTISTAAYGGYFYAAALTPKAKIAGIWFGGTGFTTVAGTFAITWSGGLIATITCAA